MADAPQIRITAVDEASAVLGNITKSLAGFAASVASIATIMQQVKSAIDLGDSLKTMADSTGVAVDKLDELSLIAAQNGAALEDLAKGFKFLTGSMVEAQDSSSKAGKLFTALGVSVKDSKGQLRDVDSVMRDAAKALNTIGNETVRSAAGAAIFGKSYQQIAASLRNFEKDQQTAADVLERFGSVSATVAGLADDLGDKFALMGEGSKRALLNGLAPGIAAVAEALNQLMAQGGTFQRSFGEVISWIATKASIAFINLTDLVNKVGISLAAVAAAIATRSTQPLKDLEKDIEALERRRVAAVGAITASAKFPGLDDSDQVTRAAAAHERLNQVRANEKGILDALATSTTKQAEAYERIIKSLEMEATKESEHANREKVELEFLSAYGAKLTANQAIAKAYALALADIADQKKIDAEATERAVKADKESAELMERLQKSYQQSEQSAKDMVDSLQFEVAALQMSNAEREKAIALRNLEKNAVGLTADELARYKEQLIASLNTRAALQQQIDLWTSIEQAAEDAFMHIFEGGRSVWERLTDSLKNTLLKLLYEMTVKRWIIQIAAQVTGNAGMLGGGTDILSALFGGGSSSIVAGDAYMPGQLFSSGSGMMSAAAPWLAAGMGGYMVGSMANSWFGNSRNQTGMQAGGTAGALIGQALIPIPVVGALIGAVVGSAIGSLWKSGGGPMTREYATSGADVSAFGDFSPYHKLVGTDAKVSTAYQQTVDKQLETYNGFIKLFGGKGSAAFALYTSQDPRGTAGNQLDVRAMVGWKSVYTANIENVLGRDPKELADRITLESKRAIFAALQASDLPKILSDFFKRFNAATLDSETIDKLFGFATAWGGLLDVLNGDPLADAIEGLATAADGAYGEFIAAGEALQELIDAYDGSVESTQNLVAATQAYYNAQVRMLAQFESVRRSLTGEDGSIASLIRSIRMGGMSNEERYNFLQQETEGLRAQLATASTPAQIERITNRILQNTSEAFGLLSPEEQRARSGEYIANLTAFNTDVNNRITAAEEAAQARGAEQITAIRTIIEDAFDRFDVATDRQVDAANTNLQAANTPVTVNVVTHTSDVNG